jgi:hypothetical protein
MANRSRWHQSGEHLLLIREEQSDEFRVSALFLRFRSINRTHPRQAVSPRWRKINRDGAHRDRCISPAKYITSGAMLRRRSLRLPTPTSRSSSPELQGKLPSFYDKLWAAVERSQ